MINRKNYLVVLRDYNNQIPDVIKDYVISFNIFTEVISVDDLPKYIGKDNSLFFIIQVLLPTSFFISESKGNKLIVKSKQIVFINVEMLTESNRMLQILDIFKYTDFTVADYSLENIKFLKEYTKQNNIKYTNKIIYLPYQFNLKENLIITNPENNYEYDVGIVNAVVKKDPSVNPIFNFRRNDFWEKLSQDSSIKSINIMGWGEERDKIINKCKVIINVHHFECFRIHESIRCDRLIFAKKIILSEHSIYENELDTSNLIHYSDYDNLLETLSEILKNFNKYDTQIKDYDMFDIINERRKILMRSLYQL
tara:strand:- start:199 stop:1128 length:930 start_codon:yes stop_codon:yes gene_type:complete